MKETIRQFEEVMFLILFSILWCELLPLSCIWSDVFIILFFDSNLK